MRTLVVITFFTVLCSSNYVRAEDGCSFKVSESELKNYRYVIVPGILNEIITYYMTEHRRFLINHGVPQNQIHRINLSSFAMPDAAAVTLEKAVGKLPKDKQFIFIGHSKGALETLYFLKKKRKEMRVKNVLLIQGPLDGASITKLPDESGFLGVLNFLVKKLVSVSFVSDYDKSYSSDHVREKLKGLSEHTHLLDKIIFIESLSDYSNLKWKFKPLGSQYLEFFGRVGDGVLMDTDHIPFELRQSKSICRLRYNVDHSDLVKAAPWDSLRIAKIKKFMERVFF